MRATGLHVMGRATYEDMAEFWPTSDSDYAPPMNDIPKVVFSQTLERAEWADSRIARGDLAAEIDKLKREPGKDMIVHGGASFVQSLSRLGLVDEYRLVLHPVALGRGVALFKDLAGPLHLELIEAQTFATGTALHVFRTPPAGS